MSTRQNNIPTRQTDDSELNELRERVDRIEEQLNIIQRQSVLSAAAMSNNNKQIQITPLPDVHVKLDRNSGALGLPPIGSVLGATLGEITKSLRR